MTQAEVNDVDLALIGYPQSGKTSLAVGLYATSTADFSVTGEGEDTESYLRGRKTAMESGNWPAPTDEGEMPELHFVLSRRGQDPSRLRFREYMGSRITNLKRFTHDVIGDPQVAMILLNPGMAALHDAQLRNEMLGQLKDIIAELGSPGRRCRYVALVVTAADLLTTSLKEFADEFNAYKDELVNCLQTSAFASRWREFAVTVSGELADPARAALATNAANNVGLPFLWLLDSLKADCNSQRSRRMRKSVLLTVLPLLLLGGGSFSWLYFWSDRAAEREIAAILDERAVQLENAIRRHDAAKVNGACQALEKSVDRLAAATPRFAGNVERLNALRARAIELIDDGRLAWYPGEFVRIAKQLQRGDELGLTPEEARTRLDDLASFNRRFESFRPRGEAHRVRHEQLVADWRHARAEVVSVLEGAVSKWMNRRVNELAKVASKQASAANCAEWRREIAAWNPTRKDCQADRDRCLESFDAQVPTWRRTYENLQYSENFLVNLNLARDGVDAVHVFENFYSNHAGSQHLREAALAVHQRLGIEFSKLREQLYVEWGERRETLSQEERQRMIKAGFTGLTELCSALARVRSDDLRRSCWYRLAMDCRARGCDGRGTLKDAFPQIARVKRLDVKMDYSKFQRNFQRLEVEGTLASYAWDPGKAEAAVMEKIEFCQSALKQEDNREWRTVWTGNAAVKFNQWTSCRFEYAVTDVNSTWGASDQRRDGKAEIRFDRTCCVEGQPVAPGGYYEVVRRLNTGRHTGDSNPEFAYRLYVEAEGLGFNDLWPKEEIFE